MNHCIDPSTCIVVPREASYGVHYAARAVAQDIREVIGAAPAVADAPPPGSGLVIGVDDSDRDRAPDTFSIRVLSGERRPTILISGQGELSAIYGLYHLSHAHLGTDPLKHITQFRPPRHQRVELRDIDFTHPPHPIKFRGWHTECNVSRWKFSLSLERMFWERLLETLLRLEGNMVKPEVNNPESMQVNLAMKMGLQITQEHCEPLGIGNWDIGHDVPGFNWSFDDFPQVFIDAWEMSMRRYAHPEKVIWTLGFRGRDDGAFWEAEPRRYDTDAKRGELITRALQAQKSLIEKHFGHLKPEFIHNTWMEGNRLVSGEHTRVPDGAHTVWSNNGYGSFRSMISASCATGEVRQNLPENPPPGEHGVYYHVAVGDACAPFLTQMVPPSRIEREFGPVLRKKMTAYLLLNVGQVVTTVMPIAAIADLWRNPSQWTEPGAADDFLRRWTRRYFGDQAGAVAESYADLFRHQIRYGEWGGWDDYVIGDMGYARLAGIFVEMALSGGIRHGMENLGPTSVTRRFFGNRNMTMPEMMAHIRGKTSAALENWTSAHQRALTTRNQLPDGQPRRFFDTDVVVQMEIHLHFTHFLQAMIDAVASYHHGRAGFAHAAALARQAQQHVKQIYAATQRRDYGDWLACTDWETYYRYAGLPKAHEQAQLLLDTIERLTRRQHDCYLTADNLIETRWIDTWSGEARKWPFEKPEVDRVLTPGERARAEQR